VPLAVLAVGGHLDCSDLLVFKWFSVHIDEDGLLLSAFLGLAVGLGGTLHPALLQQLSQELLALALLEALHEVDVLHRLFGEEVGAHPVEQLLRERGVVEFAVG